MQAPEQQKPAEADKGPKRIKLRLQHAPEGSTAAPDSKEASKAEHKDEWEDVASVSFWVKKASDFDHHTSFLEIDT